MVEYSKWQKEIFEWVKNGSGNACVQAYAGSGKSFCLVECSKIIGNGDNLFVAFNKKIQLELQERLPSTMKAYTLHALGYSLITKYLTYGNKVNIDSKKTANIINDLDLSIDREDFHKIVNIVKAIKSLYIDYTNKEELNDLSIELSYGNLSDSYFNYITKIMEKSNRTIFTIDFEDMIYLPLVHKVKKNPKQWIFIDEMQDLNNAQFKLIDLFIGYRTRVLGTGDKFQSIYGFRHASTTIMNDFVEQYNAKEFKLPITYRCPIKHVELVKDHVADIEAFEENPQGILEQEDFDNLYQIMEDESVFIARTNKYVTDAVLHLLKNKRKATAYGKDIGSNIKNYIRQYKCNTISIFRSKLDNRYREVHENIRNLHQKIRQERDYTIIPSYRKQIKHLEYEVDLIDTIIVLLKENTTIAGLLKFIDNIFSDDIKGIVCSTVHKIKGLEFDNVYVLQNKLPMILPFMNDEDIEQEENCKYVAHTRSKYKLVQIHKQENKK